MDDVNQIWMHFKEAVHMIDAHREYRMKRRRGSEW